MYGQADELVGDGGWRVNVRLRLAQLFDAARFLVGRVVFGAGAYLLMIGGALAVWAIGAALGLTIVFLVPVAVVAFAVVYVVTTVISPASEGVRTWRVQRPLRAAAAAILLFVVRTLAAAVAWWVLRSRAIARRERSRVAAYTGRDIPVAYRPLPEGPIPSLAVLAADVTTWRDLLYLVVVPLYAFAACAAAVVAWGGAVTLIGVPLTEPPTGALADLRLWVFVTASVVVLILAPFGTVALAKVGAHLTTGLLSTGESARMRAELDEQRMRRQLAVDAAEHERRRIERDLHDGAQQRLVALGMTLGLARQKLPDDPLAAAELVEEAHTEAKLAHAELRDLARGIHPAILADRGLDAALSALLRRMPLPVSIIVAMPRRPSAAVESAAYFVVSEALTNVSRHAAATRATVSVTEEDGVVAVEISDDGVGGADPAGGTGLHGLRERVAGLNGTLRVDSPLGGPSTIRAELPCGS